VGAKIDGFVNSGFLFHRGFSFAGNVLGDKSENGGARWLVVLENKKGGAEAPPF
jgi:hypothetical protein